MEREDLSDILSSSEQILLPSSNSNPPMQKEVEPNFNSSTSVSDEESDEEFDALLNRITPFKKGHARYRYEKGRARDILPTKSGTNRRSVRSMRISLSPKKHITPLVFGLTDLPPKDEGCINAKSLFLTANDVGNKTPPYSEGNPICKNVKSTIAHNHSKTCREKYSFLESLSLKVPLQFIHADALVYRTYFNGHKNELVRALYEQYNSTVFNNKLPETMAITWNSRMTKTAGYCKYRRVANIRTATIDLSTKILDCAERVRDTLLHELCHAASWIIHGYRDGHGVIWKYWASRANHFFPELPFMTRCHDYSITTKYVYKCTGCGGCIGRHSKSLNIKRKVCGCCGAKFQLLKNGTSGQSRSSKMLSKFALYVKENYSLVKNSQPGIKHAEVMKELSSQFSTLQLEDI